MIVHRRDVAPYLAEKPVKAPFGLYAIMTVFFASIVRQFASS